MGKLEKLEQLQKLKESGSLTEEEFKQEKEKLLGGENKKSKKAIIIILIVALLVCIAGGIYYFTSNKSAETSSSGNSKKDESGFEQASANMQANGTQNLSFGNMNSDDKKYTETQQEIIKYFDNDYFSFYNENVQRYPQIFQGAKIRTNAVIIKVIKSTDEEYQALAVGVGDDWADYGYSNMEINQLPQNQLFIINGNQLSKRLIKGDFICVYGRYIGTDTYNIDGTSFVLSTVNTINLVQQDINDYTTEYRFGLNTVKTVAEFIFGKDIKISETNKTDSYYKVTLDNQSNANFKAFNMYKDSGLIDYNTEDNNLSNNIQKHLFVSADFEHYIVSTYDENTKHVYIDYFDKDLKKLWSKEFDYNSTKAFASPMDYTEDKMAIVVDNDLYIIDLKTGDFILGPVLVGEKIKVNMMSDGIILIGDNNKDTIMKVDFTGKILFKKNADTNINRIETAYTQIVNGKMVIYINGLDSEELPYEKYILLNSDGTVEVSTDDV